MDNYNIIKLREFAYTVNSDINDEKEGTNHPEPNNKEIVKREIEFSEDDSNNDTEISKRAQKRKKRKTNHQHDGTFERVDSSLNLSASSSQDIQKQILGGIRQVLEEIKELKSKFQKLQEEQQEMMKLLEMNTNISYKKSFEEDFNVKIPFQTLDHFMDFNNQLALDEEFCSRFKMSIDKGMSKTVGARKSLNIILKKYFSKELLMNFTATKKKPDKALFKEYFYSKYLLDVAAAKFGITEEEALVHIGTIISNAKDWDGGRKGRN